MLRKLVGNPRLYDAIQIVCGLRHTHARLRPIMAETAGQVVLDIGAGTGLVVPLLPEVCRYVWLDNDPLKLAGAGPAARRLAVIGDATRLCFGDRSVDVALCLALSHHLADGELEALMSELGRVVRHRLVVLDALAMPGRPVSRLLWAIDRGSYPRAGERLRAAIERSFVIETTDYYAVYHSYMLCTARPR